MTTVKHFKQDNQRSTLYIYIYKKKREIRNIYQQTATTEQQVSDLAQVQTTATGLNVLTEYS